MMKKLLKHDLRAVFKYWWIGSVVSLALSLLGGCVLSSMTGGPPDRPVFMVLSGLFLMFLIIGLAIFPLAAMILVYIRYYTNFFTDEGYLTFTLPVKRSQLFLSKVLTALITELVTFAVLAIDFGILASIGLSKVIKEGAAVVETFSLGFPLEDMPGIGFILLYAAEILLIILIGLLGNILFIYFCITFGSLVVRKGKIAVAFGMYYVANSVLTSIIQIFLSFGMIGVSDWLMQLEGAMLYTFIGVIGLIVMILFAIFAAIFYWLNYWMLDRKLNLS